MTDTPSSFPSLWKQVAAFTGRPVREEPFEAAFSRGFRKPSDDWSATLAITFYGKGEDYIFYGPLFQDWNRSLAPRSRNDEVLIDTYLHETAHLLAATSQSNHLDPISSFYEEQGAILGSALLKGALGLPYERPQAYPLLSLEPAALQACPQASLIDGIVHPSALSPLADFFARPQGRAFSHCSLRSKEGRLRLDKTALWIEKASDHFHDHLILLRTFGAAARALMEDERFLEDVLDPFRALAPDAHRQILCLPPAQKTLSVLACWWSLTEELLPKREGGRGPNPYIGQKRPFTAQKDALSYPQKILTALETSWQKRPDLALTNFLLDEAQAQIGAPDLFRPLRARAVQPLLP